MSVTPIGHAAFTKADIAVLLAHGDKMVVQGLAGACVPVETEEGDLVVALLDHNRHFILCAFGKASGWYYAYDAGWNQLAEGKMIEDVLGVLPEVLEGYRPVAANAF
jgi:hypothetical protein